MPKLLAISSGGGHWEQLMLIRPAFSDFDVLYATTLDGLPEKYGLENHTLVPDCNRNDVKAMIKSFFKILWLMRKQKPDVVVTTGAAPGLMALAVGRVFGAHVIWIDSVANSEKISLSGKIASKFVQLHLTQWEHLASGSTKYIGGVL